MYDDVQEHVGKNGLFSNFPLYARVRRVEQGRARVAARAMMPAYLAANVASIPER